MKKRFLLLATFACLPLGQAAHIGVNFSENNGNQAWINLVDAIGPLDTLTANFNSTNSPTGGPTNVRTGTLAGGTLNALVDDSGNAVSTTVTWTSANAWYSGSGTADNEARLAVGYLDDGGAGASIDVTNIPYNSYDVYVLLNSDSGPEHNSEVPLINGTPVLGADFPAYGNLAGSGGLWIEADGVTRGNYVVGRGLSGGTLNIAGQNSTGNRIGISGFIIEEVDLADADGDGLPDSWEIANNLEPNDDGSGNPDNGADGNPDGDGLNNLEELQRGTNPRDADSDDDLLNDEIETNTGVYVDTTDTGTNPNEADSDGDTLTDNIENNSGVFNSIGDPGTDPNTADTDGDGFADNIENNSGINNGAGDPGTNPNLSDTDMDTLPDDWEVNNLLDPGSAVGDDGEQGDGDNDGLPNSQELVQGTDPNDSDSDDDDLSDGVETGTGIWVSSTDTGTDPLDPDTDDDTLFDGVETNDDNFVDADATGTDPHLHDSDSDGYFDEQEIAANTDPNNPNNKPVFFTPLGFWSFDDQGDSTTADLSPNGNDGTVLGGATYVEGHSGIPGDFAINLDGIDDAVTTAMTLDNIGEFTMAGWIRFPFEQTNRSGLFGQNDILEFGFSAPSNVHLWSNPGGAINATLAPSEDWVHIAFVGDTTGRTIFINGEPAITGIAATPLNASAFFFNIGGAGVFDAEGNFFQGEINDVGVWEVSMSPQLIAGLADGTISPIPGLGGGDLEILSFSREGDQLSFVVGGTVAGVTYSLEESESLLDPWTELNDFEGAEGANETTVNATIFPPVLDQNFYRVRILEEE